MKKLSLIFLFAAFIIFANAQSPDQRLRVFLDCNRSWLCDFDFVRTEMKMVDFVRDRFQSDVHVLITNEWTNNGGNRNQINFIGQQRFSGFADTLTYFSEPTATEDDKRKQMVQYLKLGLTRYLARTSFGKDLQITYTKDSSNTITNTTTKDGWNYWTFNVGLQGYLNGDQTYRSKNMYSFINASRERESTLHSIYISHSINRESVRASDTENVKINKDRISMFYDNKFKLAEHWAVGLDGGFNSDHYQNLDAKINSMAWAEYSLFPYKKFNSERIVMNYGIGAEYLNYRDTSIYFKTKEWQAKQTVAIIASFTKPWGSINLGGFWSNYLSDFRKNNFVITGAVSWKLFKGFQFGLYGNYSFIRDQVNLPKENATRDDVLTKRRVIASDFDFNVGMGLSYRFGSIFNSAVHQTFKGLNYSLNF